MQPKCNLAATMVCYSVSILEKICARDTGPQHRVEQPSLCLRLLTDLSLQIPASRFLFQCTEVSNLQFKNLCITRILNASAESPVIYHTWFHLCGAG